MSEWALDELELRHLRVLVALEQEGTFTDAAIEVNLSQPAVSRSLARLESLLGVQLVARTTRSVELTPAGAAALPAAVAALEAARAFVEAAQSARFPIRLGYTWAALGRHTDHVLQRWRSDHPDVPIEIHRIDHRDAGLSRGQVDVAIRRGRVDDPGVLVEHLFDEPRLAAVPVLSDLASKAEVSLAALAAETIVLVPGVGTTAMALWPEGSRPVRTLEVANIDEWLLAISSSSVVGVTPESTAWQHPHPGVRYIPISDGPLVPVHLVAPATHPHPLFRSLAGLVRECVAAEL